MKITLEEKKKVSTSLEAWVTAVYFDKYGAPRNLEPDGIKSQLLVERGSPVMGQKLSDLTLEASSRVETAAKRIRFDGFRELAIWVMVEGREPKSFAFDGDQESAMEVLYQKPHHAWNALRRQWEAEIVRELRQRPLRFVA